MIKSQLLGLVPMKIDVDFGDQPAIPSLEPQWKWAAVGQGKHGLMTYNYTPAVGTPGEDGYAEADHNCVLVTTHGETLDHVQHKGMSSTLGPNGKRKLGYFVPWNASMHDWTPQMVDGVFVIVPANYIYGAEVNYKWGDVQMFRAQWKPTFADPWRTFEGSVFDDEHKLEWLPYDKGGFSPYTGVWLDVGGVRTNMLQGSSLQDVAAELIWVWSPRPGDLYYITAVSSWQRYENNGIGFQLFKTGFHPHIANADIGNRKIALRYTYVEQGEVKNSYDIIVDTGFKDSEPGFVFNGVKESGVPYPTETIWLRQSYEKDVPVTSGQLMLQSELLWKNVIRFRHLSTAIDGSRAIFGFFVNHTMGTRIFTTQLDKKNFAQEDMPFRLSAAIELKIGEKMLSGVPIKGELHFDTEILYTPMPATYTKHSYEYPADGSAGVKVFNTTRRDGPRYNNDSAWCNYETPIYYKYDGVDYSRAPLIRFREILDITYGQTEEDKYKKFAFFAAYDAPEFKREKNQVGKVTFGTEVRVDGDAGLAMKGNDIVFAQFSDMKAMPRIKGFTAGSTPMQYAAETDTSTGSVTEFVCLSHARGHEFDDVFAYTLKSDETDETIYPRESTHKTDFYRISNTVFAVFEDTSTSTQVDCTYTAYLYDGSQLEAMFLSSGTGDVTPEHTYQFEETATAAAWKYPYLKKWWGSWNPYTKEWSGFSSKPVCWV